MNKCKTRIHRLLFVLLVFAGVSAVACVSTGQELATYGEMLQQYNAENAALESRIMKELAELRSQSASSAQRREAVNRFLNRSRQLAKTKRFKIQQRLVEEVNRRLEEENRKIGRKPGDKPSGETKGNTPINKDSVNPRARIKQSGGGAPYKRGNTSDWDTSGGSRAVRIAMEVAEEMKLGKSELDDLFSSMKKTPPRTKAEFFERFQSYITVEKNFNMTIFNEAGGGHGVVGSQSHATAIEVGGMEKETYLHHGMKKKQVGRIQVATNDHISKAESGRYAKTSDLIPMGKDASNPLKSIDFVKGERLQGLMKGTIKSIDSAGVSNQELASIIKNNRLNLTPEQFKQLLVEGTDGMAFFSDSFEAGDFLDETKMSRLQRACDDVLTIAETKSTAVGREEIRQAKEKVRALEKSGQSEEAHKLKSEIIDTEKRILELERNKFNGQMDRIETEKTRLKQELKTARNQENSGKVSKIEAELKKLNNKISQIYERQVNSEMRHELLKRKMVSAKGAVADLGKEPIKVQPKPGNQSTSALTPPAAETSRIPTFRRIANSQTMKSFGTGGLISSPIVSTIFSYGREKIESKAEGREFSYNRVAFNSLMDIIWYNQAWQYSQQSVYEWNKGNADYLRDQVRSQMEQKRKLGIKDVSVTDELFLFFKVSGRRFALTGYNLSKTIPLIGMPMMTGEMIVHTGISSYEKWQDIETWRRAKIQDEHQVERSAETARQIVARMKSLVANAEQTRKRAESIVNMFASFQADLDKMQELLTTDVQWLESHVEKNSEIDGDLFDLPSYEGLHRSINQILHRSNVIYGRADRIIQLNESLKISTEAANDRIKGLTQQFATVETSATEVRLTVDHLAELAFARSELLGDKSDRDPAQVAGRILEMNSLMKNYLDSAQQSLNHLRDLNKNHQTIREMLESQREMFELLDERWGTRTQNDSESEAVFVQARKTVKTLQIDPQAIQPFLDRIPELVLIGNRVRKKVTSEQLTIPDQSSLTANLKKLQDDLARLRMPIKSMDESLSRTREKLAELKSLFPPIDFQIKILALAKTPLEYVFTCKVKNVPDGKKPIYRWRFGDESGRASRDLSVAHTFPEPGTYTVRVTAIHSTDKVSEILGETETKIVVKSPTDPPRDLPEIPKTKIVHKGDYTINMTVGTMDDRKYVDLEIYPESGTFKTHRSKTFFKPMKLGKSQKVSIVFGSGPENYAVVPNYVFYLDYSVRIESSGVEGKIDLASGRLSGYGTKKAVQENFYGDGGSGPGVSVDDDGRIAKKGHSNYFTSPRNVGSVLYPGGKSRVYKTLGFNPRQDDMTARIQGYVNLKKGGGRVEMSMPRTDKEVFSGMPDLDHRLGIGFGESLVLPKYRLGGLVQHAYVIVYPSEDEAIEVMKSQFRSFTKIDVADEAYWPKRGGIVLFAARLGRIIIHGRGIGNRLNEGIVKEQLEHCLKKIKQTSLLKDLAEKKW